MNFLLWLYGYKCSHVQLSEKLKAKLDFVSHTRIVAEREYTFIVSHEWHICLNDNNFPFELLQLTEAQKTEMLKWLSINEDEQDYIGYLWQLSHIFNDFDKNGLSHMPIAQAINQNYQWLKSVYAQKYPQSYIQFQSELTEALKNPQQQEPQKPLRPNCVECQSTNVVSNGLSWLCKNCSRQWLKNPRKKREHILLTNKDKNIETTNN